KNKQKQIVNYLIEGKLPYAINDKRSKVGKEMRERVRFFDLLRCVAAVAVIAIHVLAPYRNELGVIPMDQWLTAVGVNSVTRWAVPVFILITGALMLSDTRPFD
ncbi:acyltransferase family protein, partial [Escherichia coli]|nr:acyltransferase family protein [Escherichia coli]